MAYHTPLTNSQEFTAALLKARELAHNITKSMRNISGTSPDFEVFPYTYVLLFPKPHKNQNQKALLPSIHIQGIFSGVFGADINIFYSKQA